MHARQSQLSDFLSALHSWLCHNSLALNSSKSESILIVTRQRLRTFPPVASPTIATPIAFSETIKTLGVILDQNLTLNKHVSSLSRNINFYTCALRHNRPALTESMAATLGAALLFGAIQVGLLQLHYVWNVSIQHAQTRVWWNFHEDPISSFYVTWLTDRQTTNTG